MQNKQSIKINDPTIELLLRGGFDLPHDSNCGLVVLLRGKAGTGKSTLALQLLDRMHNSVKAPRFYCTLEQSKPDLKFKLASMLAARVLQDSQVADYEKKIFGYELDKVWDFLVERLRPDGGKMRQMLASVFSDAQNEHASMPLYDEPKNVKHKEAFKKFQTTLTETIENNLNEDRVVLLPDTENPPTIGHEGSLRSRRNLVVIAYQILQSAKAKAEELMKENKRRSPINDQRATRPIIIVDGLSLLTTEERGIVELQGMVEEIRRDFQLGILVYEPSEDESTSLDHQADLVIELTKRDIKLPLAYQMHEMCFRKSRYQETALGQHQYKIRGSGIAIFPSLHFQVHHHNHMDMELKRSSGGKWDPKPPKRHENHFKDENNQAVNGSMLDLIFDPRPCESIVLLGPRNSFKTQLCLDFLSCGFWGCPQDTNNQGKQNGQAETGLLVSLTDNAPEIQMGLECPWGEHKHLAARKSQNKCSTCSVPNCLIRHVRAFCQRPGCITPAEFFHYLKERIHLNDKGVRVDEPEVKRIVFWDLTQMDYRFPLFREDKMLLPAMMDMFKTKGLKSLFMGAGNAENTPAASAMADHVVFCWRSDCTYANDVKCEGWPYDEEAKSSLMVYVDRASAASKISGKALYCVPVDKGGCLMMPQNSKELQMCLVDLQLSKKQPKFKPDFEEIERITQMQGVR